MSRSSAVVVLVAAVLAAAVLAGCSTRSVATEAPPVPAPAGSPSGTGALTSFSHPLGDAVDANHSFVEATVFVYQQPVAPAAPRPAKSGYTWGAVDAQTCASQTSIFGAAVSSLPWALVYSNGTQISPTRTVYAQFPAPVYSSTLRTLKPGECMRGWIVFAVPTQVRPALVRYAPNGATAVDWTAS